MLLVLIVHPHTLTLTLASTTSQHIVILHIITKYVFCFYFKQLWCGGGIPEDNDVTTCAE